MAMKEKVKPNEIKTRYDQISDILYGYIGKPRRAYGEDIGDDVIIDFDSKTKKVVGFMILNFRHRKQHIAEIPFFPEVKLPRIYGNLQTRQNPIQ